MIDRRAFGSNSSPPQTGMSSKSYRLWPTPSCLNYLQSLAWGTCGIRLSCWESVFDGWLQCTVTQKSKALGYRAQCRWPSLHLQCKEPSSQRGTLPVHSRCPWSPTRLGVLGNRQLPRLSIQNLMALLSVVKPSRNLITESQTCGM